jgi:hypothetical protein
VPGGAPAVRRPVVAGHHRPRLLECRSARHRDQRAGRSRRERARHAADQHSVKSAACRGARDDQRRPTLGRQAPQLGHGLSFGELGRDLDAGHAPGGIVKQQSCGTTRHLHEVVVGDVAREHLLARACTDAHRVEGVREHELGIEGPRQPRRYTDSVPRRLAVLDRTHHRPGADHVAEYLAALGVGGKLLGAVRRSHRSIVGQASHTSWGGGMLHMRS